MQGTIYIIFQLLYILVMVYFVILGCSMQFKRGRSLSISSSYLKMCFRSRGLSFYQYVNTLRAEHAFNLMQEHPDMSIADVCEHSGFRSQTTFRKVFQEIMGCLPSKVERKAP